MKKTKTDSPAEITFNIDFGGRFPFNELEPEFVSRQIYKPGKGTGKWIYVRNTLSTWDNTIYKDYFRILPSVEIRFHEDELRKEFKDESDLQQKLEQLTAKAKLTVGDLYNIACWDEDKAKSKFFERFIEPIINNLRVPSSCHFSLP